MRFFKSKKKIPSPWIEKIEKRFDTIEVESEHSFGMPWLKFNPEIFYTYIGEEGERVFKLDQRDHVLYFLFYKEPAIFMFTEIEKLVEE